MNNSIYLVVGTCFALAMVETSITPVAAQTYIVQEQTASPAPSMPEKSGPLSRLWDRISHGFKDKPSAAPARYPVCGCGYQSQPVPQTQAFRPEPVVQASAVSAPQRIPTPELVVTSDLKAAYVYHIGHADDYSWVTGQLFYIHASGGLWMVRYATVDTEDRFGGSVVLAPAVNMKNFREGDLVSVQGAILNENRASKNLGGPSYRADYVELIERADQ